MSGIRIVTERFFLRPLKPGDATERYAAWFRDPAVKRYIVFAQSTPTVDDLCSYIEARTGRPDVLFLGIFENDTGTHIGNLKFEPIDRAASRAVLGIMIGDAGWRGRGAAIEVITGAIDWLANHLGICEVVLGVQSGHQAAIRAYEKAGFSITERRTDKDVSTGVYMVWRHARTGAAR